MKAVIQCGGKGTRLMPYTTILPKPLMPIGPKPVLEMLLKWLRRNGISEVCITTGYLGHLIRTACGDGRQWDMRIQYTDEKEPLGTMGPLSLLRDQLDETFLVLNGDVLTDLSIRSLVDFHRRNGAPLTIASTARTIKTEFGMLEECGGRLTHFREKPVLSHLVSMGVYCMEPDALAHIPSGVPFGFDDLVLCMLAKGTPIGTFKHAGMWLDVGRVDDFKKAQELDWEDHPPAFEIVAAA
jgi:mannose-1-phosphate guanylyltransferase